MSANHATRRRLLHAVVGVTAVTLAGCSQQNGTSTERTSPEPTASPASAGHGHGGVPDSPSPSAEVRMRTADGSTHFDPHVVWVEEGGTVTFVNYSGRHSATAYAPSNDRLRRIPDGGRAFDSGVMNTQGSTHEVTLDTPGVYDYYCIPHESSGMIGSVIVGQPEPSDQPGLSEPTEVPATTHEKIRSLNGTVIDAIGHSESSDGSDHGTEADHQDTQDGHHG